MPNSVHFAVEGTDETFMVDNVPAPSKGAAIRINDASYEVLSVVLSYWPGSGEVTADVRVRRSNDKGEPQIF